MIITEIKKIGKGERYSIYLDGIFNCSLEAEILVRYKLKLGQEIDHDSLKNIKLENGKISAFSRALTYIEKGLRTQKGVRDYLKEKGFLQESIDDALKKLAEYGYINDKYFAESYINTYCHKKGRIKLKYDLISKGVPANIIEEALENLDEEASFATCQNIYEKYTKNKEMNAKMKAKTYAYLMSKGFESDIIKSVMEQEYESWN